MDIIVKTEPTEALDDQEPQGYNRYMAQTEIKEEYELVINNEYYQDDDSVDENAEEDDSGHEDENDNVYDEEFIKNEMAYEQFTIEFLDDKEDVKEHSSGDADDGDIKNCNSIKFEHYNEDEMYSPDNVDYDDCDNIKHNDNSTLEGNFPEEINSLPQANEIAKKTFGSKYSNKLVNTNYIKRKCPVCETDYPYLNEWSNHIISCHKEIIQKAQIHYDITTDKSGTCKTCNQVFLTDFSRYIHSLSHTDESKRYDTNICKICNYNFGPKEPTRSHLFKEHPEIMKEFLNSDTIKNPYKCPLCLKSYDAYKQLWYHFISTHPTENQLKFSYRCHLCSHPEFMNFEPYLIHLTEKHDLNSWKVLNYRKLFEDKQHYGCTKCNRILLANDSLKLLKHFLEHEPQCKWTCWFCKENLNHNDSNLRHMCLKMLIFYSEYTNLTYDQTEFENIILHICPFCNKDFDNNSKWEQHLRKVHKINSYKSLGMKYHKDDTDKLCCTICSMLVVKKPEILRNHCFQHLVYKLYKCKNCDKPLENLKIAVSHFLSLCRFNFEDKPNVFNPRHKIKDLIEIRCLFEECGKFNNTQGFIKHYKKKHHHFEEFFSKKAGKTMKCILCDEIFKRKEKLIRFYHIQKHSNEKSFKCNLCGQTYARYKSCKLHIINSHCIKSQRRLQEEQKITTKSEEPEVKQSHVIPMAKPCSVSHVLNEYSEYITYACPECNEAMSTQEDWYTHITTQHNFFEESQLSFRDADGSPKCPTCKLKLPASISHRQKHKLTHMPFTSFVCNLCFAGNNSLGVLYGHFRRIHFAKGTFECPICNAVLETSFQRSEHIKTTHPRDDWPSNICPICYKIFSSKVNDQHFRTHNRERFKYVCKICGVKMVELKSFKGHMERHTSKGEVENSDKDDNNENILKTTGSKKVDKDDNVKLENKNTNKRKSIESSPKLKNKKVKD